MADEQFTRRELQVLSALCALPFRSQQEIALDLGITARTLRSHISTMLAKTRMADQRELVLTQLHARLARQDVTQLSRAGRRLAVVTVTPIIPMGVDQAIVTLNLDGRTIFVMSTDVDSVIGGLEGG